jgi:hypothetical protein
MDEMNTSFENQIQRFELDQDTDDNDYEFDGFLEDEAELNFDH